MSDKRYDVVNEELKRKTISQQRAKLATYEALVEQGLPIPRDLKEEIEGRIGRDRLFDMPNPTEEDLASPIFEAIWQTIRSWDVNVPEFYQGYCGANGSHVKLILDALEGVE